MSASMRLIQQNFNRLNVYRFTIQHMWLSNRQVFNISLRDKRRVRWEVCSSQWISLKHDHNFIVLALCALLISIFGHPIGYTHYQIVLCKHLQNSERSLGFSTFINTTVCSSRPSYLVGDTSRVFVADPQPAVVDSVRCVSQGGPSPLCAVVQIPTNLPSTKYQDTNKMIVNLYERGPYKNSFTQVVLISVRPCAVWGG